MDGGAAAQGTRPVDEHLSSLGDDPVARDSAVLVELMRRISGHEPQLWNVGTIGFGAYRYRYDSGREGECQAIGFYPRKGKITVYLMDGTSRHAGLLARLGRHTTSRVCLTIRRLDDIDLQVLEEIVRESYAYVTARDGHMHRVVE